MIELATPISTLFEDKEACAKIISLSDCLECRETTIESDLEGQSLFHFENSIVACWSDREKDTVRRALELKKELRLISFHILAACSKPVLEDGMFRTGGKVFSRDEMLNNAAENISWLKALIKERAIDIAVENNNYYPTEAYGYVTDADFINEIVVSNKILFLFDIAHAKITSYNKKLSYREYITALPLGKLVQIHISKEAINDKDLSYDAHDLPDMQIFQEIEALARKFSPKYITIEYYKDNVRLIHLLEQYKELCNEFKRAV